MSFSKNQRLVAGTLAGVILVGSLATVVNAISGGNGVIGNYSVNESAGTDEAFQKAAEDYILEIAQQGVQAMHDKNSVNVMTYTDMDIFYYMRNWQMSAQWQMHFQKRSTAILPDLPFHIMKVTAWNTLIFHIAKTQ